MRDGRAAVQDEGSQLVALALAAADAPGPATIDLAAGPGGKAALLAALGMDVAGLELHETRARLVARSGVAGRGRRRPLARRSGPQSADRVLLDAPCSGLGALRRRPEARWRRTAADIEPLAPAAGGSCCAAPLRLTAPRRRRRLRDLLAAPARDHRGDRRVLAGPPVPVETVDARPLLPAGMPQLGAGPTVQLWPHRHGTDAMFLALLRR